MNIITAFENGYLDAAHKIENRNPYEPETEAWQDYERGYEQGTRDRDIL